MCRKSSFLVLGWMHNGLSSRQALAVAALWDVWLGGDVQLLSCNVVTTEAAQAFKPWHSRMPVMLSDEEVTRWLDNGLVIKPTDSLFRAELNFSLHLTPIDRAAGNARNKALHLMKPAGPEVIV